jgi:hypothetical protein
MCICTVALPCIISTLIRMYRTVVTHLYSMIPYVWYVYRRLQNMIDLIRMYGNGKATGLGSIALRQKKCSMIPQFVFFFCVGWGLAGRHKGGKKGQTNAIKVRDANTRASRRRSPQISKRTPRFAACPIHMCHMYVCNCMCHIVVHQSFLTRVNVGGLKNIMLVVPWWWRLQCAVCFMCFMCCCVVLCYTK